MTRLLALAALILCAPPAFADPPTRDRVLALIVTNNHSAESGRPELRYADDDGAKYYDLFRTLGAEDDVELLTDFDRDSAQLFPDALGKAHSPTKAEVAAAVARLAARAHEAERAGRATELYFVFAGHGDVEQGRGFLELRDGRLTSDDLEAILRRVAATRAHVILDSCNSFFVLSPRKPGGKQIAVTEQAAQSLAARLPNVGVFLSTSAEAEVFEWSELQSGIFSHAVRSGLAGAADADHDGRISYEELRAFVEIATAKVKNPLYRPRVFARAPGGRADVPIVDLAGSSARRLEIPAGPRRLTVRDPDELPWIDLNEERGAATTLYLPARWAARATIDERAADGSVARYTVAPGQAPAQLAQLTAAPAPATERGPDELLSTLFAAPFGAVALAQWRDEVSNAPGEVYGVSTEDAERMRLLLAQVADVERGARHTTGVAGLALSATMIAADLTFPTHGGNHGPEVLAIGSAAAFGALSLHTLFAPSPGEHLYDDYVRRMADPGTDKARVVADTEKRLNQLADRQRRARHFVLGFAIGGALLNGAFLVGTEHLATNSQERGLGRIVFGSLAALNLGLAASSLAETPTERMRDLWTHDPGIEQLPKYSVGIAPTAGGGALSLSARF